MLIQLVKRVTISPQELAETAVVVAHELVTDYGAACVVVAAVVAAISFGGAAMVQSHKSTKCSMRPQAPNSAKLEPLCNTVR